MKLTMPSTPGIRIRGDTSPHSVRLQSVALNKHSWSSFTLIQKGCSPYGMGEGAHALTPGGRVEGRSGGYSTWNNLIFCFQRILLYWAKWINCDFLKSTVSVRYGHCYQSPKYHKTYLGHWLAAENHHFPMRSFNNPHKNWIAFLWKPAQENVSLNL
jgi:hypothetical protein